MTLLSACSLSIIPEGAARGAPAGNGEWVQGDVPAQSPQSGPTRAAVRQAPVQQTAGTIEAVDSEQITPVSDDDTRATGAGIALGPDIPSLNLQSDKATAALKSFRTSCSSLVRRTDNSGLTEGEDWRQSCEAAKAWQDNDARSFFEGYFEAVQVGDGKAFATGYFEPQIQGSRVRSNVSQVPIYKRPSNLLDVDLGQFSDGLKDKRIRGKVDGTKLVPFEERAQIDDGALQGKGLELAWASDYIEFFFLQIQGSGRVAMPDGSVMRIGYDGQNGRDYTGIGRVMRERGLLADGKTNMQGIIEWLRANPEEGRKIMRENKSYIFFRELTGPGPLGAMSHPVVGRTSVASDPKFVPLGAPVFLDMDHNIADGLWVAQDTGGAIKGSNRFDTFWGAGEEAAQIAGGMSSRGQALIFLPKGSVAKLLQSQQGN
ncbi:murein transglycosylase A [Parasphingorhabdus cellanae]|uniref:peptidoglycan lytic exotransglycosylase n=1 Tax=Parasphingorhabdus cellanae TaxID=2806553 RepID=A0ABX7T1K9_9SPHN|nr:murein transglycosylase A [Parasphingorhabdus cellanae]QTD54652.1 murein transglycosylase A [Parasphingorhabdus cellanae]